MSKQTFLSIKEICKSYPKNKNEQIKVLDSISIDIKERTITTVFGPNGSGKTTLLNIIAGISKYDSGSIVSPIKRINSLKIGFVFQDYYNTILPWAKSIENIGFPLQVRGIKKEDRDKRVYKIVEEFQMDIPLSRYPYQLSGGQNQMISISRALILNPDLLIMDEPSKSLDYNMRLRFGEKLLNYLHHNDTTTVVMVSHDLDESIFLSDKIVVLSKNPSQILETIDVNLDIPKLNRSYENTIICKEFQEIKERIIRLSKD